MNSGRDPDDLRDGLALGEEGRVLWQARWFRATVVFSLLAASAVCLVPTASSAAGSAPGSGEPYWVQVGAYRDVETAKRVAERLRADHYQVQESVTTRPAPGADPAAIGTPATTAGGPRDRYEVVVTGSPSSEVAAKLTAKGLASQSSGEGIVITPSLFLGEAVALSRDLSGDGFTVRVRRVGAPGHPAPATRSGGGRDTLHRVRVGGFADRGAALAALKALEARGYKAFLTRGSE